MDRRAWRATVYGVAKESLTAVTKQHVGYNTITM